MLAFRNVVLGVSGGVDSSVAAILLKKKGFNVTGVYMKNWDLTDENGFCSSQGECEDAKFVCTRLKIPFVEVNFVKEYWNEVFSHFLKEYQEGLTPNPDVLCNKFIKFRAFYDHAINHLKADAIATGHYAKTSFGDFLEGYQHGANAKLFVPKDRFKDQTLFLCQVPQEPLRRTMFPLGNLTKSEVKKIAIENGLEKIAKKPESKGICFIGKRKFGNFISEYIAPKPGRFINMITGEVEGNHEGIHFWTVGQRSRMSNGMIPSIVVKKIPKSTDIYVVKGSYHPALFSSMFFTEKPYWIADPPELSHVEKFEFRFQHARGLIKCNVVQLKDEGLLSCLERPLRAITPGQYAVFYKNDECLGSAKISQIGPSEYSLGNSIPDEYTGFEDVEASVAN